MNFDAESISGLCDVNCVRLVRRLNGASVIEQVDSGQLLWVFDVSPRKKGKGKTKRELRFWAAEIFTPQFCARLTLREVINKMLPPSRKFFSAGEICRLLLVSPQTLGRIAREMGGVIHNCSLRVTREAFAAWLAGRWLGSAPTLQKSVLNAFQQTVKPTLEARHG